MLRDESYWRAAADQRRELIGHLRQEHGWQAAVFPSWAHTELLALHRAEHVERRHRAAARQRMA
jgi:hypothetical protein